MAPREGHDLTAALAANASHVLTCHLNESCPEAPWHLNEPRQRKKKSGPCQHGSNELS